jgi:hypothetical protein
MPSSDRRYETPKWRTFWLLAAFALLIGIGVVTVLVPELDSDPDGEREERGQQSATGADSQ